MKFSGQFNFIGASIQVFLLFILLSVSSSAQKGENPSLTDVGEQLRENADAIVIDQSTLINLMSEEKLVVSKSETILVLNESGKDLAVPYLFFDNSMDIKSLTATYYNVLGNEIEKVKKNKFSDRSAIAGYSLYEDDRVYYHTGRPAHYPYFVKFEYEYETENTLFIPPWKPLKNYAIAVQQSTYTIINPTHITLNIKKQGFEDYGVDAIEEMGQVSFAIQNVQAIEQEDFSIPISEFAPQAKVSPSKFNYDGISGEFTNWESVGKWINSELLNGQDVLPGSVKTELDLLVQDCKTQREKVARIYDYMQEKCRYISIQIGIGGWKPASANEVHNTSYGDCKALTNYTMALLEAVEVPSYYTIVYAGSIPRDIDKDYVSIQGNHVILCVPLEGDTLWLECTAHDNPCGYIAGFTDDRDVFVVTPEGGSIVHTKVYNDTLHFEKTTAVCTVFEDRSIKIDAVISNSGSYYGRSKKLLAYKADEIEKYYKEEWDLVHQLILTDYSFSDRKENEVFEEHISSVAPDYLKKMGNSIIMRPNVLLGNRNYKVNYSLDKSREFYLSNSFSIIKEFTIILPEGYSVAELPETISVKFDFGSYFVSVVRIAENKIRYYRELSQTKGVYPAGEYANYIKMLQQVKKNDATNILINKL